MVLAANVTVIIASSFVHLYGADLVGYLPTGVTVRSATLVTSFDVCALHKARWICTQLPIVAT